MFNEIIIDKPLGIKQALRGQETNEEQALHFEKMNGMMRIGILGKGVQCCDIFR